MATSGIFKYSKRVANTLIEKIIFLIVSLKAGLLCLGHDHYAGNGVLKCAVIQMQSQIVCVCVCVIVCLPVCVLASSNLRRNPELVRITVNVSIEIDSSFERPKEKGRK
jgi:hypothetical protein